MHIIENFKTSPLIEPKFVHPVKINYQQNGIDKQWEAVQSHDSVAILLYHVDKNAFLLVKQFRPPVYLNNKNNGITFELCAGILDKNIGIIQIAQEEIYEECGYKVPLEKIQKITSFYTSVGITGAHQTLYYSEINDSMKEHNGGGIEHEEIELHFLPLEEAKDFIIDETKLKTPGLMFSFYWFFDNKVNDDRSNKS